MGEHRTLSDPRGLHPRPPVRELRRALIQAGRARDGNIPRDGNILRDGNIPRDGNILRDGNIPRS